MRMHNRANRFTRLEWRVFVTSSRAIHWSPNAKLHCLRSSSVSAPLVPTDFRQWSPKMFAALQRQFVGTSTWCLLPISVGCFWVAYLVGSILSQAESNGVMRVGKQARIIVRSIDPKGFADQFLVGVLFCAVLVLTGALFALVAALRISRKPDTDDTDEARLKSGLLTSQPSQTTSAGSIGLSIDGMQSPSRTILLGKRIGAFIAGALALGMSLIFAVHWWNTRADPLWPIVSGSVVERKLVATSGGGRRTELTIRIEPRGPSVRAVLMMNASGDIPDSVHFRYGGDPSKEVVLEEETSSLAGFFLGMSLLIGLVVIWPRYERHLLRRGR